MPFDVISSATMVERDLNAVWEWFDYRRGVLSELQPNPAHYALAEWQDQFSEFTLVTQNVDGLHVKAGSRDVIEVHGSIWRSRCLSCGSRFGLMADEARFDSCPSCGERVRPDVVLFGEMLPMDAYERAAKAASECDLCFVIGTSALVYPAASLPEIAKHHGAFVVEVNPERTPLSDLCNEVLTGKAGEIVPLLNKTSL